MGDANALIIAYYFPPENTSGAARPYRFFKYLPRYGFHPIVVCESRQDSSASSGDVHQAMPNSRPGEGAARFAARVAEKLWARDSDRLVWVPQAVASARRAFAGRPLRVVFSTHPPLATHLTAAEIKRRHGCKWVADFRDPIRRNHPDRESRYVNAMERYILEHADVVIANTEPAAALWRSRYPRWKHKVIAIWNGFDPEEPVAAAPIPPRDFQVMVHTGDIYGPRHPGLLLASLERLAVNPQKLRVRLVGPIESDSPLLQLPAFEALSARGVVESNRRLVPRTEALAETAAADFLLLLDLTVYTNNVQVPAKLFDYIRVGRPILAFTSPGSPAEQILALSGVAHICIYPNEAENEIDRKVSAFLKLPANAVPYSPEFAGRFDASRQTEELARLMRAAMDA